MAKAYKHPLFSTGGERILSNLSTAREVGYARLQAALDLAERISDLHQTCGDVRLEALQNSIEHMRKLLQLTSATLETKDLLKHLAVVGTGLRELLTRLDEIGRTHDLC